MGNRRTFRVQKSRAPLFASTLVLLGGFVSCLAIATPFSDSLTYPLLVVGGLFLGIALLMGLLRRPTQNLLAELEAITARRNTKTIRYELKKIKNPQQSGPRKPPDAATIREIRGK